MSDDGWSGAAKAYSQSFAWLCAGTFEALIPSLEGEKILDLGCGTGLLAQRLVEEGKQVTGVDPEPGMLELAEQTCANRGVRFLRASLPNLPFDSCSFDSAAANFVLNHVSNPRSSAIEAARVLKPGGSFAATIWTSQPTLQSELMTESFAAAHAVSVPSTRLSPEMDFERSLRGLSQLLASAGLEVEVRKGLNWTWRVTWAALWEAIAVGTAGIGRTYLGQNSEVKSRIRQEMRTRAIELEVDGALEFPSTAAFVVARKSD